MLPAGQIALEGVIKQSALFDFPVVGGTGANAGARGYVRVKSIVQQQVGQLLQMVGSEKLCYASDAAFSGCPAPYLRAFMELEIPDDLRDGFGYPQITRRDRENILGLTFARLMGIDVEAKKRELAPA